MGFASFLVALSLLPARAIHEGLHVLLAAYWLEDWSITLRADSGTAHLNWTQSAPWYAPALAYLAPLVICSLALAVVGGMMSVGRPPATAVGRASTVVTCLWLIRAGVLGAGDLISAVSLATKRDWTPPQREESA